MQWRMTRVSSLTRPSLTTKRTPRTCNGCLSRRHARNPHARICGGENRRAELPGGHRRTVRPISSQCPAPQTPHDPSDFGHAVSPVRPRGLLPCERPRPGRDRDLRDVGAVALSRHGAPVYPLRPPCALSRRGLERLVGRAGRGDRAARRYGLTPPMTTHAVPGRSWRVHRSQWADCPLGIRMLFQQRRRLCAAILVAPLSKTDRTKPMKGGASHRGVRVLDVPGPRAHDRSRANSRGRGLGGGGTRRTGEHLP